MSMIKWSTLVAALKQRSYEDALNELAVIQNYDDLQDALQVIPFKSLNQDLPASLLLLEKLYAKFMSLTTDKEEARLIIRHVFKADLLLRNYIRVEVEGVLIGGIERDFQCKDLIGHITQITWTMDSSVVEELMSCSSKLKSAFEHYQNSKSLLTDFGFEIDDIKSNLQSCLTSYHSFVHHLESLTKASTRKHSEGKGYTVMYKEEHERTKKSSTSRYNAGHPHSPPRSRSLIQDVRSSVEQVRKRRTFNQAVLDVIEPCEKDMKQGPCLLQSLRELVDNDNKFLDVISGLSSHITSPCFAHMKLDKILGHFVNSYDSLLSAVTSRNKSLSNEQKSGNREVGISADKDVKISLSQDFEISIEKVKDADPGLVDHGLKIDVTTSSPFRRRFDARRPTLREQKERRGPLRTHSCREPRSDERASPAVSDYQESEAGESKLKERLAMRDKQLAETRSLVKNLKKREEQLLEKLTAQAKNHLMRSEKFENISDELPRTEQLIRQFDDLYSQLRLEAMDDLDNIESLNCLEKSDELKSQISFAVMTVSFHFTGQELEDRRRKIFSLLGVHEDKIKNGDYVSLNNEILLQLRRAAAEVDLKHVVDNVTEGLFSTMFDFPELWSCRELRHFTEACVRFSWTVSTHVPPLTISYDATTFTSSMHSKSHNSDKDCNSIRHHVWPALLDSQTKAVLFKGIVTT